MRLETDPNIILVRCQPPARADSIGPPLAVPVTPPASVVYAAIVSTADDHVSVDVAVSADVDVPIDAYGPVNMNVCTAMDSVTAMSATAMPATTAPRVGLGECCSKAEY